MLRIGGLPTAIGMKRTKNELVFRVDHHQSIGACSGPYHFVRFFLEARKDLAMLVVAKVETFASMSS